MRLAAGTSVGRLGAGVAAAEVAELGIAVADLAPLPAARAGIVSFRGRDAAGRGLLAAVHGRDAYENQVLATAWRALAYRDDGPTMALSRVRGVEHEALVTLLALRAGVPTPDVVTAGATADGDAILVLEDTARPAGDVPDGPVGDALVRGWWDALGRLAGAGVAHLRIGPDALVLVGGEPGIAGFAGATLAPTADQLASDRAQLLACTAALADAGRAVRVAGERVGREGLAALLPYLQPAAFGTGLRRALRTAGVDVARLRAEAAAASGAEEPRLVKLRRVTAGAVVQGQLRDTMDGAVWGWIALAAVVAQLPRVALAFSTLGSIVARLAFGPVYMMQLAVAYMNLVLPSNIARIAMNVRFFQKQGVPPASAVASGAVESVVGNAVQVAMLGLLLLFTDNTIAFDLEGGAGRGACS